MVIDASAILAILLKEPETAALANAMAQDGVRLIGAVSAPESAIVIENRKGTAGTRELDLLLHKARVDVVSMNAEQVQLARSAYTKYGKGRHPAGLNLGDCCSYALARYSGEPLLFKGNDFRKTDIAAVDY